MPRPRHIERITKRGTALKKSAEPKSKTIKGKVVDFVASRNDTVKTALVNWKTTVGGLATLFGGVTLILTTLQDGWQGGDFDQLSAGITAITGGFALVFARDADKSSQDSGIRPNK